MFREGCFRIIFCIIFLLLQSVMTPFKGKWKADSFKDATAL